MTPSAITWQGDYYCNATYASIQNTPSGLVTGNCSFGSAFETTLASDQITNHGPQEADYWLGGMIRDPAYNSCGWINLNLATILSGNQVNTACSSPSKPQSDFVLPGYIYTDGSGIDGLGWNPVGTSCPAYANVRPWVTNPTPNGAVSWSADHRSDLATGWDNNSPYRIRYVSAYSSSTYGTYWVMVHNWNQPRGQGNWAFVSANCLFAGT